jgi:hypothetical protein
VDIIGSMTFLKGRGVLEKMEDYNVIRVFCSIEKPIFLPYYISDKLFIIEIARQYKFWFHTLSEKRKKSSYLSRGKLVKFFSGEFPK